MRATDIIRNLLDLMDEIDRSEPSHADLEIVVPAHDSMTAPADQNHFKQIFDILSSERNQMYNNSPNAVVTGIEAVTTHAGGGWNGPKHPSDIRSDSVSMYPNYGAK